MVKKNKQNQQMKTIIESLRAFGINRNPTWEDFLEFLEDRCFPRTRDNLKLILQDLELDFYDPFYIIEKTKGRMGEDMQWLRVTYLNPAST